MTISLELALYRLLHVRSYRRKLLEGRFDELELSEADARHLRTIDTTELVAFSEMICRNLLRGELEYEGGLRSAMPGILQALERAGSDATEVMYRFVESPEYGDYRQIPLGGEGLCIEEAFYTFLLKDEAFLAADPYHPWLLTHEFLSALLKLLALNPTPAFAVRSPKVRANPVARFAVERYPADFVRTLGVDPKQQAEVSFLYATNGKRFVRGPTSPLVGALLEAGTLATIEAQAVSLARAHDTTPEQLQAVARGLNGLGLVA